MIHPQFQQLITLLILFGAGKWTAHIYPSFLLALSVLFWSILVEYALVRFQYGGLKYIPFSAGSTAMGVLLMMATPHGWIYGAAITLALLQKHIIRVHKHHFFNPSNFAVIMALLLFYSQAHVVLGQLGEAWWMRGLVIVLAGAILVRVERWIIPFAFVAGYLAAEYVWVVGYDPVVTFEAIYERFYSVSLVVFVAFMLTDPRTTPVLHWQQGLFGLLVAMIATGLDRWYGFRVQHLFMALFILSPWVPWLQEKGKESRLLWWGALLSFVAIGVIILIENRPPYYFEMEG